MSRMAVRIFFCALCAFGGSSRSVQGVSPVQKVIELLEENKAKVASDLAAEEKEMAEYTAFCDDELTTKGYAIKTAIRSIADLKAAIEEGSAEIAELEAEVAQLGTEMAEKEKELGAASAARSAGKGAFEKTEAELVSSVDELERALVMLKKGESFLQTSAKKGDVKTRINAALAALSTVIDASTINVHKRQALKSLIQTVRADGGDDELALNQEAPKAAAFESATGGIIEKVEEMKEKAEDSLSDARNAETKAQMSFDMIAQSLNDAIKVGKEKLAAAKSGIETATQESGEANGELVETEKAKAADEKYVETLKMECEQTATEWAARQASAKEEMSVIDKAKDILASRVKAFVQVRGTVAVKKSARGDGEGADEDSRATAARSRVVEELRKLSRRYRSYALMELTTAAQADPFEKIKGLIEDMIAKLLAEANEEATQKAFCDEEMGKSNAAKEEKSMKLDKTQARLDKAATTKAELEASVKETEAEIAALDKADAEATTIRQEESASNMKASKDFKDSAEAVSEAISVLKEYYEGALVQTSAGVVRSSQKAPSFGGAKSDASHAIISILEMSGEDFEKMYMETEQEESEAASAYKKLMDEDKISKASKLAEVKGAESEIKSLTTAISNNGEDVDVLTKELDAILSYLDKLKPQCETKVMSYAEKKAKREAEIEGLKTALSILEGEAPAL